MIKVRIDKQALNPLSQEYLIKCLITYSKTLNKALIFTMEVADNTTAEFKSKL